MVVLTALSRYIWWQQWDTATTTTPGVSSPWIPKAPKYSSNLRVYFDQLDSFFDFTAITADVIKIAVFKSGLPSDEYSKFCLDAELPKDYSELKVTVLAKYEPSLPCQSHRAIFHAENQRQGESVLLFLDRLRRLCRRAYPTLTDSVRNTMVDGQFRRNLRIPQIRQSALLSKETDLDALASELADHAALQGHNEPAQLPVALVREQHDELSSLRKMVEDLALQVKELGNRTFPSPPRTQRSRIVCWNCDVVGHVARDCRRPLQTCACGGRHLPKFCRQRVSSVSANRSGSSACVLGKNGNSSYFPILMDSGSVPNLISQSLWKRIGSPQLSPPGS